MAEKSSSSVQLSKTVKTNVAANDTGAVPLTNLDAHAGGQGKSWRELTPVPRARDKRDIAMSNKDASTV